MYHFSLEKVRDCLSSTKIFTINLKVMAQICTIFIKVIILLEFLWNLEAVNTIAQCKNMVKQKVFNGKNYTTVFLR